MKITFFYQKPSRDRFSMMKVFDTVRKFLPAEVEGKVYIPKYVSKGILPRIYDIIEVAFHQGDINHITGDVHFLSYLLKKNKTVLTIHDCVHLHSKIPRISKIIISIFWYIIPLRRAAYITTISEASKKEIAVFYKYDPDKIVVIPNPISPDFFYSKKIFNEREPIILQIGTAPNKNLFNLFKALKGVSCHLHLVGHLDDNYIKALGESKIKYTNFTNLTDSQIVQRYQECDLVSFISNYEGFGVPIIEANAVGRPVVTSNISPLTEVADNAACFVDPYNIESMREGILKVIKDKTYQDILIKNGQINAKRFSPQNISDQYMKLYKQIILDNR
ncbi:MAG: hypothetical protein ACD_43C00272G0002 [uncultured bacterium]|nr:MAG: hypothetical protein ACD_43C00272G0002 [uncultured bacterium]